MRKKRVRDCKKLGEFGRKNRVGQKVTERVRESWKEREGGERKEREGKRERERKRGEE